LNRKNNIIINITIIDKILNNFKKYRETILMNKNLLIAGIFGFIASAAIA
jgi:hypothetical protein